MSEIAETGNRDDLELIVDAARKAGQVAQGYFRNNPEVWWKNEGRSPVSAADFAANETLETILKKARPEYGWLSEETDDDVSRLERDTLFVIDPIDGTRGFIAGSEQWCVSVAVVTRGRPTAGVLYAPALDELYVASTDGPALKNGTPIAVSSRPSGETLRLASSEELLQGVDAEFRKTVQRIKHVPSLAYRLAMVADGRLEATLVKTGSHDWDLAAVDLILERAGGALADLAGQPLQYNGRSPTHGELCGAPRSHLQPLLKQLSQRRDS